jgi:GxxExxY protein
MRDIDEITGDVIDIALRLHRDLGGGLLESAYELLLAAKLELMDYKVERQCPVDIAFEGVNIKGAFRIDLLIDSRLIIELKSVERLNAAHSKQVLTYLRLTNQPVGLLINFGGATLKEGLKRIVNDHKPSASPRLRVNQNDEALF